MDFKQKVIDNVSLFPIHPKMDNYLVLCKDRKERGCNGDNPKKDKIHVKELLTCRLCKLRQHPPHDHSQTLLRNMKEDFEHSFKIEKDGGNDEKNGAIVKISDCLQCSDKSNCFKDVDKDFDKNRAFFVNIISLSKDQFCHTDCQKMIDFQLEKSNPAFKHFSPK
jgi:hypothetical protein